MAICMMLQAGESWTSIWEFNSSNMVIVLGLHKIWDSPVKMFMELDAVVERNTILLHLNTSQKKIACLSFDEFGVQCKNVQIRAANMLVPKGHHSDIYIFFKTPS